MDNESAAAKEEK